MCILLLYINDMLLIGSCMKLIKKIKTTLSNEFNIKDLEKNKYYLRYGNKNRDAKFSISFT